VRHAKRPLNVSLATVVSAPGGGGKVGWSCAVVHKEGCDPLAGRHTLRGSG
jgi:hypothetical protein